MSLSDRIRSAIVECELSLRQLAEETGVAQPILSRFILSDPDQRRDIRLATADKLAEYFELELAPKRSGKKISAAARPSGRKSGSTKSAASSKPRSRRGTTQKLTPKEMKAEIERVKRKKAKGRGLKIARVDGE